MAKSLRPPKELLLEGNLKDNFRKFKQQFQLYLTATQLSEKEEDVKSSTLLHVIGAEALEIYNTFSWREIGDREGDEYKMDKILNKFEKYCNPRTNVAYERHIFNKRSQEESESIDVYVTDLKRLASSCEFENLKDSLIRDRIVCGVKSDNVRSRLLRECDLTLENALDICRASESSDLQMKRMTGSCHEMSLNAVKSKKKLKYLAEEREDTEKRKRCQKCGIKHEPKKCPAYGKTCHKCGKRNHFAKKCLNEQVDRNRQSRKVHPVDTEYSDDTDSDYLGMLFDMVYCENNDWIVTGEINNREMPMLVDTGASCNVISSNVLKKLRIKSSLDNTQRVLRSFSGHSIKPIGTVKLKCVINGTEYKIKFQVVHQKVPTILGANVCTHIGLVMKMFPVGLNKKSNNIKPMIHAPRKVPVILRSAAKTKLTKIESEGILESEREPTDWVNSRVTVVKPSVTQKLKSKQRISKEDFDRQAGHTVKPLQRGEEDMFQQHNSGENGTVNQQHQSPRSYILKSSHEKMYRRNRKHIRPTKSQPDRISTEDLEIPGFQQPTTQARPIVKNQDQQSKPYVTRYGRTVKPPEKYS